MKYLFDCFLGLPLDGRIIMKKVSVGCNNSELFFSFLTNKFYLFMKRINSYLFRIFRITALDVDQ
jgi:hypothetical protein